TESIDYKGNWSGIVYLKVEVANCFIYSYGFMENIGIFDRDVDCLPVNKIPVNVGRHELKDLSVGLEMYDADIYRHGQDAIDGLCIEIFYSDQFDKFRYRSVFQMTEVYSQQPKFKLIKHQNL